MKSPNLKRNKSLTLLEILIALVLLSVVVIGFSSIDIFSRYHLLTSSKRTKLQNEISYILEHITKKISKAIGNEAINDADEYKVVDISELTDNEKARIKFYVDGNDNGMRDSGDHWEAYRFYDNTGPNERRYHIFYCAFCAQKKCNNCQPPGWEKISGSSGRITSFVPSKPYDPGDPNQRLTDNYVGIAITACWDPTESSAACGTPDNPEVEMSTRIKMPSVSIN